MKRYCSFLLVSVYLFSVFQLNEYFKIPILVDHFYEHQKENPSLSIFNFIAEHYSHNHQNKDKNHDNFPFKSSHSCCSCISTVAFCAPIQMVDFENGLPLMECKKLKFIYTFSFISNFQSSIWQPPKIC